MDDHQTEISEGGLFIRRGLIQEVGPTSELPQTADEVLDLKDHVVLPGLVNTHHHFYQTLTRAVPAAQDANLFNWLTTLYPHLGAHPARRYFHLDSNRACGTRLVWMYHRIGPSLSLPERIKTGQRNPRRAGDRTPHSGVTRLDVPRRFTGRTSA